MFESCLTKNARNTPMKSLIKDHPQVTKNRAKHFILACFVITDSQLGVKGRGVFTQDHLGQIRSVKR